MRLIFYRIVCFLLLTNLVTGNVFGQITSNADRIIVTSVIHADTSIHVFYGNSTDTLKAINRFTVPVTFIWTKFDTTKTKNQFDTDTISTDSILIGYPSGGYRVKIIPSSGKDSTFVAWIFIDKLSVVITKDANGDNNYLWYSCEYTDFRATSSQSNFIYYNSKGQKQTLPAPKFEWTAEPPINPSYKDTTSWLRMDTTKGMQYEKAVYKVLVKDKFGATSKSDSVKYSPIVCKAIIDTTGAHPTIPDPKDSTKRILSAPLTITFLNKSKNAVHYVWKFSENKSDTAKRNDTVRIVHTFPFTSPRDTIAPYKVFLISQSLEQCVDTVSFNISISPGQIERLSEKNDSLPNYFTPDAGSYNKFRIFNVSIRQFKFTVFSKWGKKVYEASGPNMLDWEGWDGKVLNTGRPASDGVYFYVLEVISWDRTPDSNHMKTDGKYHGFFYLFRAK